MNLAFLILEDVEKEKEKKKKKDRERKESQYEDGVSNFLLQRTHIDVSNGASTCKRREEGGGHRKGEEEENVV